MKTLDAGTLAHLAGETTTFAILWRIQRTDGVDQGFTNAVADLVWVDPVTSASVTFKAETGATVSNLQTTTGRGIDNLTAFGLINSVDISEGDLLKGIYDGAKVTVILANYENTAEHIMLAKGFVGEVKTGRDAFEAEVRTLLTRANQTVGKIVSADCRVEELGNAECGKDLTAFTFTGQAVSAVTTRSQFSTTSSGVIGKPATYFAYGKLTWTTGANTGKVTGVRNHDTNNPCLITLSEIMPYPIAVSDQFTIVAGCDRNFETCKTKFNNVLNFRGEPHVPGTDAVLKVQV